MHTYFQNRINKLCVYLKLYKIVRTNLNNYNTIKLEKLPLESNSNYFFNKSKVKELFNKTVFCSRCFGSHQCFHLRFMLTKIY